MARDTGLHLTLVGSKGMNRGGLVTGSSLTQPLHTHVASGSPPSLELPHTPALPVGRVWQSTRR